jgi:hypothetical protein
MNTSACRKSSGCSLSLIKRANSTFFLLSNRRRGMVIMTLFLVHHCRRVSCRRMTTRIRLRLNVSQLLEQSTCVPTSMQVPSQERRCQDFSGHWSTQSLNSGAKPNRTIASINVIKDNDIKEISPWNATCNSELVTFTAQNSPEAVTW